MYKRQALEAGNITKDENYQAAYQQGYNTSLLQAYEAVDAELNTQAAQIESVITKLEEEIRALEEAGDTSGKLEELKTQLAVQETALAQINSDAFRSTVKEQAKEELDAAFPEQFHEQYRQQALEQVNGYLSQLDTGQSQIDQAEAQLDAGQGQLDSCLLYTS